MSNSSKQPSPEKMRDVCKQIGMVTGALVGGSLSASSTIASMAVTKDPLTPLRSRIYRTKAGAVVGAKTGRKLGGMVADFIYRKNMENNVNSPSLTQQIKSLFSQKQPFVAQKFALQTVISQQIKDRIKQFDMDHEKD
ncbi:hypothetical protein WR25_26216 isoform A [Diploscapter pachys]|nr:hypothetical protein WR25_26216 isoform A [Diploscapter pachys]